MQQHRSAPPAPRYAPRILLLLLVVAFALRLAAAFHYPNIYFPDEIFQTQEIAHRLAFGHGITSWEWREGIRSYVFPYLLASLMRTAAWISPGTSAYLIVIPVAMSLFSLSVVWFCYAWASRTHGRVAAMLSGGTAAVWFVLVFFGSKTLSELLATDVFLPGILIGTTRNPASKKQLALSGLLCGLAVALRPQLLPTAAFAAVWICWSDRRRLLPVFAGMAILPILASGLVDAFTLSFPFASIIRYAWLNVAQGRARQYGTSPVYFYFPQLLRLCGPLVIPAIWGVRRSPFLGWLVLVLVGSHSVLAHKEIRFVFLAIPLIITLSGIGCAEGLQWFCTQFGERATVRSLVPAAMLLVIGASLLMNRYFDHWHHRGNELRFANAVRDDPATCGVAYFGMDWSWTGGYTYVHRSIPILYATNEEQLERDAGQYNALLTSTKLARTPPGFLLQACDRNNCTYRRTGPCSPPGGDEMNSFLLRTGR